MAVFFYSAKRVTPSEWEDTNECYGLITAENANIALQEAKKQIRYDLGNTKAFTVISFNKVED